MTNRTTTHLRAHPMLDATFPVRRVLLYGIQKWSRFCTTPVLAVLTTELAVHADPTMHHFLGSLPSAFWLLYDGRTFNARLHAREARFWTLSAEAR